MGRNASRSPVLSHERFFPPSAAIGWVYDTSLRLGQTRAGVCQLRRGLVAHGEACLVRIARIGLYRNESRIRAIRADFREFGKIWRVGGDQPGRFWNRAGSCIRSIRL